MTRKAAKKPRKSKKKKKGKEAAEESRAEASSRGDEEGAKGAEEGTEEGTGEEAERPFDRSAEDLTQIVKSVIHAEPRALFRAGYYMVLLTVAALTTWASLSYTNISHFAAGEVRALDPGVVVTAGMPFRVQNVSVSVGMDVTKARELMTFTDEQNNVHALSAPVDGIVTRVPELRRGILFPADTAVAEIEPGHTRHSVRLFVDPGQIGRIQPGNPVIFHISGLGQDDAEILRGRVASVPVPEGERYVAQAEFEPESLAYLERKQFKLISGYPLTGEIVVGRQRLISLLLKESR